MSYTPITVALLRQIRRSQGRPLRSGAADIGITAAWDHAAQREHPDAVTDKRGQLR
ncbi:hypothetical protein [Mycolicibacterium mageritense]|uniref:hypothetical protein n=1 Tax=Mycolicibacterium mageritense TaxID=53462 RepID=UPI0023F43AB0|nr:hypothetical protein [Mycolicibacterium mageritense]